MPTGMKNPKLQVRTLRGRKILNEQKFKLRELGSKSFLFSGKIQGRHVEVQLSLGDVLRVRNRVRRVIERAAK